MNIDSLAFELTPVSASVLDTNYIAYANEDTAEDGFINVGLPANQIDL